MDMDIGYFGSSTGAAAALIAATRHPEAVSAIVSRGGRPDLAKVKALSSSVRSYRVAAKARRGYSFLSR